MSSKQERQLNQGQIDVLMRLYKFRFGSRELIADSLGKTNGTAIYSRLNILVKHGYVGMRFEPSYKLAGRPAEYYLLPKGLRTLRDLATPDGLNEQAIKNSYKDKHASASFISHCLNVYAIHNQLINLYDSLQFFTKRELAVYDYFPKQLPDGFLSLKTGNETRRFFLEVIAADAPPFAVDRRLRQIVEYYDDEDWSVTELPFPAILCVCETGAIERRFRKQVHRQLHRSDADLLFYTTTTPAILRTTRDEDAMWSDTIEPDVLHSLESLTVNP